MSLPVKEAAHEVVKLKLMKFAADAAFVALLCVVAMDLALTSSAAPFGVRVFEDRAVVSLAMTFLWCVSHWCEWRLR